MRARWSSCGGKPSSLPPIFIMVPTALIASPVPATCRTQAQTLAGEDDEDGDSDDSGDDEEALPVCFEVQVSKGDQVRGRRGPCPEVQEAQECVEMIVPACARGVSNMVPRACSIPQTLCSRIPLCPQVPTLNLLRNARRRSALSVRAMASMWSSSALPWSSRAKRTRMRRARRGGEGATSTWGLCLRTWTTRCK